MPTMQARTKNSRETWKSPDGKVISYELILEVEGADMTANTYSKVIKEPGWSGTVDTYEKNGRTFVKQPPKEGFSGGGSSKAPTDNYTMYLSYAKDIVVALLNTTGYDKEKYDEAIQAAQDGGNRLYEARNPAKAVTETFGSDSELVEEEVDPWQGVPEMQ